MAQSCPTLCDPMNCSTSGLRVHHQLPESFQTHVHWVGDAIQPSHPLSSPSPPALNLSQLQGLSQCQLFASSSQSIGASASVLPVNIQGWFPLGLSGLISLLSTKLYFLQKNIVFLLSLFLLCPFNYHPQGKKQTKTESKKKKKPKQIKSVWSIWYHVRN